MFAAGVLTGMGLLMAAHGALYGKPVVLVMGVLAAVAAAASIDRRRA
jgi:hypothetical protein